MEFVSSADILDEVKHDCDALGISFNEVQCINIDLFLDNIIEIIEKPSSNALNINPHIPPSVKKIISVTLNESEFNDVVGKIIRIIEKLRFCNDSVEADKVNIADVSELTLIKQDIGKLVAEVRSNKLGKSTNVNLLISQLSDKYPHIPYSCVKILVENPKDIDKNLPKLTEMVEMAMSVKKGNVNFDRANQIVEENLRTAFVYPKFGGKDSFYKKMDDVIAKSEAKAAMSKQ